VALPNKFKNYLIGPRAIVLGSLIYGLDKFRILLTQLLLVNLIVIPIIIGVSLTITIATCKRGLDPDNIIPIESSLSDSITSLALYFVLRWSVP